MFANEYFSKAISLLQQIQTTQNDAIIAGAKAMADSIAAGRATYLFGSGHSVIPVLDAFPRYGSYIGLRPLMDPRLMWFNVIGPGGARELLWLERTEGYIANVLASHSIDARDTFVIYSHGGLNSAAVEMALAAKAKGAKVIAVTSTSNRKVNKPTHSSGKSLHDVADIIIDNSCPPEDALVSVPACPTKSGLVRRWRQCPSPWPWWPKQRRNWQRAAKRRSGSSSRPMCRASSRNTTNRSSANTRSLSAAFTNNQAVRDRWLCEQ